MSYFGIIVDLGDKLSDLVVDQSKWSQETFGEDSKRGPLGALKHLAKEAVEAQDAWIAAAGSSDAVCYDGIWIGREALHYALKEELADCLLLILDASRRAGVKPMQLIEAAQKKMEKNKARTWPNPTSNDPVEHDK